MQEEDIKKSFSKVKEDINKLEIGFSTLKEALSIQNNVLLNLTKKISFLEQKLSEIPSFVSSKGNNRVKQSIKHLSTSDFKHIKQQENTTFEPNFDASIRNEGVQERLAHIKLAKETIFEQEIQKEDQKSVLRMAKDKIEYTFNKLSKQELKVFLAIYQLEEEQIETSYRSISEKMKLSEPCIRAHICSLFKKKAPLYKVKLNNRQTLIFIDKDFKSLNLKQKLINLYYKTDPYQSTLFDPY